MLLTDDSSITTGILYNMEILKKLQNTHAVVVLYFIIRVT
jgi:hypothetical protein